MKHDLAGGKLLSDSFGENAAWWWSMILAFNINALIKNLVIGEKWKDKRMKAIRFNIIHIPARIINHSRQLIIQLQKKYPNFMLIKEARARILEMGCVPAGQEKENLVVSKRQRWRSPFLNTCFQGREAYFD